MKVSVGYAENSHYDLAEHTIFISHQDSLSIINFDKVMNRCFQDARAKNTVQYYMDRLLKSKEEKGDEDYLTGINDILDDDEEDDIEEIDEPSDEETDLVEDKTFDEEKPIYNMLGERVSKEWFAKHQKEMCRFSPDFSFDKNKYKA